MNGKKNLADLVAIVSKQTRINPELVEKFIGQLFKEVERELLTSSSVQIDNLGIFRIIKSLSSNKILFLSKFPSGEVPQTEQRKEEESKPRPERSSFLSERSSFLNRDRKPVEEKPVEPLKEDIKEVIEEKVTELPVVEVIETIEVEITESVVEEVAEPVKEEVVEPVKEETTENVEDDTHEAAENTVIEEEPQEESVAETTEDMPQDNPVGEVAGEEVIVTELSDEISSVTAECTEEDVVELTDSPDDNIVEPLEVEEETTEISASLEDVTEHLEEEVTEAVENTAEEQEPFVESVSEQSEEEPIQAETEEIKVSEPVEEKAAESEKDDVAEKPEKDEKEITSAPSEDKKETEPEIPVLNKVIEPIDVRRTERTTSATEEKKDKSTDDDIISTTRTTTSSYTSKFYRPRDRKREDNKDNEESVTSSSSSRFSVPRDRKVEDEIVEYKPESKVEKTEPKPEPTVEATVSSTASVTEEKTPEKEEKKIQYSSEKDILLSSYTDDEDEMGNSLFAEYDAEAEKNKFFSTAKIVALSVVAVIGILVALYYLYPSAPQASDPVVMLHPNYVEMKNQDTANFVSVIKAEANIDFVFLSKLKYGSEVFWPYIYKANEKNRDASLEILNGSVIFIPRLDSSLIDINNEASMDSVRKLNAEIIFKIKSANMAKSAAQAAADSSKK